MKISLWSSLFDDTGKQVELTWPELVDRFRTPQILDRKEQAGGWSPGIYSTTQITKKTGAKGKRTRCKANTLEMCAVGLDYEAAKEVEPTSIEKILDFWGGTRAFLHTTFSHTHDRPRCRVIFALSRHCTGTEYEAVVDWLFGVCSTAGHQIDTNCRDSSRFWYLPATCEGGEYQLTELDGVPLDVDAILSACTKQPEACAVGDSGSTRYFDAALESALANIRVAPQGARNNLLAKEAYALGGLAEQAGMSLDTLEATLIGAARTAGWSNYDDKLTVGTIRRQVREGAARPRNVPPKSSRRTRQSTQPHQHQPTAQPISQSAIDDDWTTLLIRNERGSIVNNLANIATIMEYGDWAGALKFNSSTHEIEITGKPPGLPGEGNRAWEPGDEQSVAIWLQRVWRVNASPNRVMDAALAVARNHQYNPIKTWLNSLRWDGVERLDTWLTEYCGAIDTPYNRAIGAAWLRSVVARGLKPGAKVDAMLVFEGSQGAGKSTVFRVLGGQFYASLRSVVGDRAIQEMLGKLIVELAELEALDRAEVGALKGAITREVDRVRLPYDRRAKDLARTAVLCGTCNRDDYLRDETGNRRFWPTKVAETKPIDIAAIERDRDQLFAEALHQVRGGREWWLPPELFAQAEEEAKQRVQADVWEDRVMGFLENKESTTIEDVLGFIGFELERMGRIEQMRVAKILRGLGWCVRQVRRGGARQKRYFPPTSTYQNPPTPPVTDLSNPSEVGDGVGDKVGDTFGPIFSGSFNGVTDVTDLNWGVEQNVERPGSGGGAPPVGCAVGASTNELPSSSFIFSNTNTKVGDVGDKSQKIEVSGVTDPVTDLSPTPTSTTKVGDTQPRAMANLTREQLEAYQTARNRGFTHERALGVAHELFTDGKYVSTSRAP